MPTISLAAAAAAVIAAEKEALLDAQAACEAFLGQMTAASSKLADIPINYPSPARGAIAAVTANLAYPLQEIKNRLLSYEPPPPPVTMAPPETTGG